MLDKAKKFAQTVHEGQERKFSGNPYHYHPRRVAKVLSVLDASREVVAAGLLHDTIEDTEAEYFHIANAFGERVANLVLELTNSDGVLEAVGKTEYLKRKMLEMSDAALVVKLADRKDNTSDLEEASKSFRVRYSESTKEILDYLEAHRTLTPTQRTLKNSIRQNIDAN